MEDGGRVVGRVGYFSWIRLELVKGTVGSAERTALG